MAESTLAKKQKIAESTLSKKQRMAIYTAITTLITAFTGAATLWAQSVRSDLSAIREQSERLGKLETHVTDIDKRIERFDDKLDKILFEIKRR